MTSGEIAVLTASAAIVGAGVGALATGAVQTLIASRDRKRAAMVAARLLTADLGVAYHELNRVVDARLPTPPTMPDMSRHLDTWAARRADFAAAVDLGDFQIVANAFANLERYVVAARANRFPTPGSLLPLVESIADARAAAWIASGAAVDQTIPTSIGLTITGLHRDAAGRVRLGSTAERDADDECDAQEREP